MRQIKSYSSGFTFIDKAIQWIPEGPFEPKSTLRIFNETIANYNITVEPLPISHLQELQKLEKQLEDHALQRLWDALWDQALVGLVDRPKIKTIEEIREWFVEEKNQPILDKVFVLNLRFCNLIQLPKEIFQLRNLEELDLYGNSIEVLPESIKVWKKLRRLNLSYNELTCLPHNGIKYLKRLRDLHVRDNRLDQLPRSIRRLKRLKRLNVEQNYLTQLSQELGQCRTLEVLNIAGNEFSELSPGIKNLTALKIFSAADNNLKTVPKSLKNWKRIKKVQLGYNFLTEVSEEFFRSLWPNAAQISIEPQSDIWIDSS